MIDMLKAKEAFASYVRKYPIEDDKIRLKIQHTYKVSEIARKIAEEVTKDPDQIQLAELIGLLHDIGRFEQVTRYHTFLDAQSINHAELGVQLLKEGLLRTFLEDTSYDAIIYQAIENHNRYQIREGLDPSALLHAKIIRDADKTDIFRVNLMEKDELLYHCTREELWYDHVTDEIYEAFLNKQSIESSTRRTHLDILVSHIAFLFDYNYAVGLRIVAEKQYIQKLLAPYHFYNHETQQRMQHIKELALQHLKECC